MIGRFSEFEHSVSCFLLIDLKRVFVAFSVCCCVSMNVENVFGGAVEIDVGGSVSESLFVALHTSVNGFMELGPGNFVSMRRRNVFCRFNVCSWSASSIC